MAADLAAAKAVAKAVAEVVTEVVEVVEVVVVKVDNAAEVVSEVVDHTHPQEPEAVVGAMIDPTTPYQIESDRAIENHLKVGQYTELKYHQLVADKLLNVFSIPNREVRKNNPTHRTHNFQRPWTLNRSLG